MEGEAVGSGAEAVALTPTYIFCGLNSHIVVMPQCKSTSTLKHIEVFISFHI
jgi:hypothetical protein